MRGTATMEPARVRLADGTAAAQPIGGLAFDRLMALLGALFLGGLYLDGWAHNNGQVDESFFTPWHAVLYGSYLLVAAALLITALVNHRRGLPWRQAIPHGYGASAVGIVIFGLGGIGDMVWHILFGIEEGLEALFSPTHLLLGIGFFLVVSGPLRAAWHRQSVPGWAAILPMLLSLAATMTLLTFFMMGSHPLVTAYGGRLHRETLTAIGQLAGLVSVLITAALLTGPLLLAMRRWRLPFGAVTLVIGINLVAMGIVDGHHDYGPLVAAGLLLATLIADQLQALLRCGPGRPLAVRIFAFALPSLYFLAYFIGMMNTEGLRWSVHLWGGAVVLAGLVGLLLSYLVLPPALPAEADGAGVRESSHVEAR